ncbi:MAG: MotA/TolQ/ExbB proton channel family protein [Kiritimatiellae bacterium]|nr:MotA/TolQ/ExbB proton channel family protein [Kiritimatiellia bacterium]
MSFLFANSLIDGFFVSNTIGKSIVIAQIVSSVIMLAAIIGKWRALMFFSSAARRFMSDFAAENDVLGYYLSRRPSAGDTGFVRLYAVTCDRLLKILQPNITTLMSGRSREGMAALTAHEVELVRGTCEHVLDEQEIELESGMGAVATVVALSPMLGLLGTVWGVLDAFAEMGSAGSANLATIAPSISSALVTTVVGLLIAIPGVLLFNLLNAKIRELSSKMVGFSDELMGRIACEFQGRSS